MEARSLIITHKNLKVLYWDKVVQTYKHLENKSLGYNLVIGQRLQAIRYDNSNKILDFDVIVRKIDDEGIVISKNEKLSLFPWTMSIKNWKGEPELNTLEIEPICHLKELIDICNAELSDEQIYNTTSGYSIYHENIKNFIRLGQLELVVEG